jgi:hypothetical protein
MFIQDLVKPSIQLDEDGLAPTLGADPGTPPGLAGQGREPIPEVTTVTESSRSNPDWHKLISEYLRLRAISDDEIETRRLVCRVKGYLIHDDETYHRCTSGIIQQCIPIEECKASLLNIHEWICGHHASSRSMVGKALWQGFFWPTTIDDAVQIVRSCMGCQYFTRQVHTPAQEFQTIPITWPFAVWGLDLLGPFRKAPGGFTHLLEAFDRFTKWIEPKPMAIIGSKQDVSFLQDIVFHFGVPNSIITDNGTQFTEQKFLNFYDDNKIWVDCAADAHPLHKWAGQAIKWYDTAGPKAPYPHPGGPGHLRLAQNQSREVGHRGPLGTLQLVNNTQPLDQLHTIFMVYGSEAVLPTEPQYESPRVQAYHPVEAEQAR